MLWGRADTPTLREQRPPAGNPHPAPSQEPTPTCHPALIKSPPALSGTGMTPLLLFTVSCNRDPRCTSPPCPQPLVIKKEKVEARWGRNVNGDVHSHPGLTYFSLTPRHILPVHTGSERKEGKPHAGLAAYQSSERSSGFDV